MPRKRESNSPHKLAIAGVAALIWLVIIASELLLMRELSAATSHASAANAASIQEKSVWTA